MQIYVHIVLKNSKNQNLVKINRNIKTWVIEASSSWYHHYQNLWISQLMLYVTISSLDLVLPISYHVIWYNNVSCQIQYQFVLITYKSKSQHTIILYHIMKTDSVVYIIWYNTGLYLIKSYNHPCSQIKTQLKWTKEADRKNHP